MAKRIVWTEQARTDLRAIERPIALQILRTLGRYVLTGEGNTRLLRGIEPPLIRLRAQNHRIFFRDKGDYLEIPACLIARRLTGMTLLPSPNRNNLVSSVPGWPHRCVRSRATATVVRSTPRIVPRISPVDRPYPAGFAERLE